MSATSEFRDVLARIITEAVDDVVHTDMALFSDEGCADEILATPEMQAIREWVKVSLFYFNEFGWPSHVLLDAARNLGQPVLEWAGDRQ